ncbi:O-antigen ligase family protein, partial [Candidatus Curtissbacteria bacterium]|nr:O-antigen ligase family protein [Candidatus Curtissbacteria bacterium]
SFNTLGSANSLAILEAIVIPLTVSWVLFGREKVVRLASTAASVIMVISLILINFAAAYFSLAIGILLVASLVIKAGKLTRPAKLAIGVVALVSLVILAVRYIPQTAELTLNKLIQNKDKNATAAQNIDTPKNLVLSQRIAWDIATSTIGKRPLFGTGPGTYLFAYTQLKPRAVNGTTTWSVRFDKSSSDFTEIIATTGIVGIIAFIIFVATVVRFIWTLLFKSDNNLIYLPVAASAFTFVASQFFATSGVSTVIPFFITLSSLVVLAKTQDEKHVHEMIVELATLRNTLNWLPTGGKLTSIKTTTNTKSASKSQLLPYIFLVLVAGLAFLGARNQVNAWQGEFYYRKALLAAIKNDGNNTIDNLQKAIAVNPSVDTYHRELSATAVNAAITLSNKKDLSDDQRQLINQLAQVAIQQGGVASGYKILPLRVPGISSANAANWETVSIAYQALIGQLQGADVDTINTLGQASALDPENPILHEKIGALYLRLKNLDSAQRKFEDATVTKPDYGPAHYDLALVLIEKNGDVVRIAQELAAAKRFLPANDPALGDINTKLADYNKKVEDLQKQTNQAVQNAATASPSPTASPKASTTPNQPAATPVPTPAVQPTPTL